MFPAVNDFNVVVGGIATFAATVGYACAKKLVVSPTNPIHCDIDLLQPTIMSSQHQEPPTGKMPHETLKKDAASSGLLRRSSLKRKRTDEEEEKNENAGYPHNLSMIYPPKKRARTPTAEEKVNKEEDVPSSRVSRQASPEPTQQEQAEKPKQEPTQEPQTESTTAPKESTPETKTVVATPPASPKTTTTKLADEPKTPSPSFGSPKLTTPSFPKTPFSGLSRQATSSAFAAFAGSASPFAKAASSPFLSRNSSTKSIWALDSESSSSALLNPNGEPSEESKESDGEEGKLKKSAIEDTEEASSKATLKETVKHVSGEEDEDVELELKNVKLFMKRGEKPFTTGMIGHIKLLSNKTTLDERLLFRREPLWQVTMNVKVTPTVRCSFDEEETNLRIVAMEQVENSKYEPVIYAMRPARSCTKQDFTDFAKSLMASPGFKAKAKAKAKAAQ